jgi:hypothetical protein
VRKSRQLLLGGGLALAVLGGAAALAMLLHAARELETLRRAPRYATPAAGVRRVYGGLGRSVEIVGQGCGEPFADLCYVVARVHMDGDPTPHEPGAYFLHLEDGWVFVPEDRVPEAIAFGKWVFDRMR